MRDVVEACPRLRGVVISPCTTSETIPLVKRYCPNLCYLGVNPMYNMPAFLDNATASPSRHLTHLVIGSTTSSDLEEGLKAYCDTLEEVWVCNEDLDRNVRLFPLSDIRIEKLRKLVYYGRIDTNEEVMILHALLCSTASLEVLHVYNYSATALDMRPIYRRLAELPRLKELELHCYLESEGVETYLDRMVALRNACPLESVTLRHFPVTRVIFQCLANIPTLRELTLWFPAYDAEDLAFFLRQLSESGSSVEMLHLHSRSFMTEVTLEALGRIPSLKRLTLSGYRTIREREMLDYYMKKYESRFQMTISV
ncbi:hypothetical protein BX666DRAFT_727070 [Dichotomocladium elegans]|nr:hypothetical protein BX666DRAFT_727070 [Dichotomocladium elegans]